MTHRSTDLDSLAAFLDRLERPETALALGETYGFLFAVACAPELVPPSEWIPQVLGGEGPAFRSRGEARRLLGALMNVYNEVTSLARADEPCVPDACALVPDPVANLAPTSPVASWSRGFREGHGWLEALWDAPMPEDMDGELGAVLLALTFFGLGDRAAAVVEELTPSTSVADVAATMHRLFPDAVTGYARMGRILEEAYRNEAARAADVRTGSGSKKSRPRAGKRSSRKR